MSKKPTFYVQETLVVVKWPKVGQNIIKLFLNWIYKDKGLFLKRKYESFQLETLSVDQLQDRRFKIHKNDLEKRKKNIK